MTTILAPLPAITRWLRGLPLFRTPLGRHCEHFFDMQYARKLRRMADRPVYTPPVKLRVDLPYLADGSYSAAPLEPLPPMDLPEPEPMATASDHRLGEPADAAEVLGDGVYTALLGRRPDETVIEASHDLIPFQPWLEQQVGGDPLDGSGSNAAYVEERFGDPAARVARLFAGTAVKA